MKKNELILSLEKSYKDVGDLTWQNNDFVDSYLQTSRSFFTTESLKLGYPSPKKLEVYALLSGISFELEFVEKLTHIQSCIDNVIGDCLHYWVKPLNFGIEYCVFKWPDDNWNHKWTPIIQNQLDTLYASPFTLNIYGIQINRDGCVVAKGYDDSGTICNIRSQLKTSLKFLPEKQSNWAHIPLGRIMEPIGLSKFLKLKKLIEHLDKNLIGSIVLKSAKFVHEKKWYMEDKDIISKIHFKQKNVKVIGD